MTRKSTDKLVGAKNRKVRFPKKAREELGITKVPIDRRE